LLPDFHYAIMGTRFDMEINVIIDGDFAGCPDEGWFRNVAQQALSAQGVSPDVEVSLLLTGQGKIRELNRTYRGKDRPTDVLAFFMTEAGAEEQDFVPPPDGMLHLGEVIISYPQAVLQAEEQGHPVRKELTLLLVHGLLHLLGYDHEKPEESRQMRQREQAIMSQIYLEEDRNDG